MPEYTKDDCRRDTQLHIDQVQEIMQRFSREILQRSLVHDLSKLESPEVEIFTEFTPKLKHSTYGSDEYKGFLASMKVGLDHHYANNSHHPEYFENGIEGMNLLDIVEMFADWKAATMRHADGDIMKSIDHNEKRFNMSSQLVQIFKNTVKDLGLE